MSIQSEIVRINGNVSSAYTAIDDMGGTLPETENSANLATAIRSIPIGGGASLPNDPQTDGGYKLVNTIATENGSQSAELSWEEDISYTAGNGIEIDNNNEISIGNNINELIFFLLASGFQGNTAPSGNFVYLDTTSPAATIRTALKNHNAFTTDKFGGVAVGYSDLYALGIEYISEVPNYDMTTGTTPTAQLQVITNSTTGNYTFARHSYSIGIGNTIYVYSSASQMRTMFTRMLADSIVYKNNFANFSGSRLSAYLDGIDSALTGLKSVATTQTAGLVKPDGTSITVDANGVISSQGGSSLPTDPSTDGIYKLVNTVETEGGVQTATQTWEEDSSGGSSYTFTNGLTESSGTVSWDLNDRIQAGTGDKAISINGGTANGVRCIAIGANSRAQTSNYNAIAIGTQAKVYNSSDSYEGMDALALGKHALVKSSYQTAIGGGSSSSRISDGNRQFDIIISNNANKGLAFGATDKYMSGDLYVGCTDYTTTSSGLRTANCGGQKVFYGTLTSTDTAPSVGGAINWVYK